MSDLSCYECCRLGQTFLVFLLKHKHDPFHILLQTQPCAHTHTRTCVPTGMCTLPFLPASCFPPQESMKVQVAFTISKAKFAFSVLTPPRRHPVGVAVKNLKIHLLFNLVLQKDALQIELRSWEGHRHQNEVKRCGEIMDPDMN